MKKLIMILLAVFLMFGCGSCAEKASETKPEAAEPAPWTMEGMFAEHPDEANVYIYIDYETASAGDERDGYFGYLTIGDALYMGALDEADGALTGELVSYNDDWLVDSKLQVTVEAVDGNVRVTTGAGEEYLLLLVPDDEEYDDSLKFFLYGKIYQDKEIDPVLGAVYTYLALHMDDGIEETHIIIPYVNLIATDESDPKDVLAYGDYYLFEFAKQGDTLAAVSGQHCPGIVHLKKFSEDAARQYEGQRLEAALTDEETIELFGEYYDEYCSAAADPERFEQEFAQLLTDYVSYNSIEVTKYSLTDGEAKPLPQPSV